jgi:uroporphyrinogen-III synthase
MTSVPKARILVTRAPQQASALAERLRELGAEPVLVPTIETVEPTSFAALDDALGHLQRFDWLLFTSANAVEVFVRRLGAKAAETADRLKIAAIGPSTARAAEVLGLRVDLIPPTAVAESLAEALLPHACQTDGSASRFLLVRAEEGREFLPETLRAAGGEVTIAPAYRTMIPQGAAERLREAVAEIDAVTFTSSSTARNLAVLLDAARCVLPNGVVRASIGPITSATLCELGLPPQVEALEATVDSLAEGLMGYLRNRELSGQD